MNNDGGTGRHDTVSMSHRSGITNPLSNKPFDDNPAQNALATLMGGPQNEPDSPGRDNTVSPQKGGFDFSREQTDMPSFEEEPPQSAHINNTEQAEEKKKKKKKKDKKDKKDKKEKREKSNIRVGEVYNDDMSKSGGDVMAFD